MTPSLAVVRTLDPEPASSGPAPEWLVAEMPPGYRNRYEEIQRLTAEIRGMDQVGRLLWEQGDALREAVRDAFVALKTEPEWSADGTFLTVKVDGKRRLLVHVAGGDGPIEKKSEAVAAAFRTLQEATGADDRAVLVTTGDRNTPPKQRGETATPEAQDLLKRMGVNVLPCPTLFNLWMLSLTELNEARTYLELLHGQDGGPFKLKTGK